MKSHQVHLTPMHKDCKGSSYNVIIEWDNREITAGSTPIYYGIKKNNNVLYTQTNKRLIQSHSINMNIKQKFFRF